MAVLARSRLTSNATTHATRRLWSFVQVHAVEFPWRRSVLGAGGRLVAGVKRDAPPLKVETTVEDAVVVFLEGLELDSADVVAAETFLLLARKLDRADSRTAPPLADRLVSLCDALRLRGREPDRIRRQNVRGIRGRTFLNAPRRLSLPGEPRIRS